jgi:N-acetylglutamate synthase-like GNAT family acetyltransferase
MVRDATAEDEDAVLEMARQFVAFAPYADTFTATDEELRMTISQFIMSAKSFVAEVDGKVVGMLAAVLTPVWYAPSHKAAVELAWWVDPAHRKGMSGIRLVQAFEKWAKEQGASMVSMSNLEVDDNGLVANMLNRFGYRMSEQTHSKRIN